MSILDSEERTDRTAFEKTRATTRETVAECGSSAVKPAPAGAHEGPKAGRDVELASAPDGSFEVQPKRLTVAESLDPELTRRARPGLGAPVASLEPDSLPLISLVVDESLADADLAAIDHELIAYELIGEGGMGRVYAAHQSSLGRRVAIKRLKAKPGSESRRALVREARLIGALEHPHIVPVHTLGRDADGSPILVMKRIEGVAWRTLIQEVDHPAWKGTPAGEPQLLRHLEVAKKVCQGLRFAHNQGVIHRDIKPDNVMIGSYGEVYILDWGIALDLRQPRADEGIVGTPAYLAPEMLTPTGTVDARTDVFLIGAALHEVLTGAPRHAAATVEEAFALCRDSLPQRYPSTVAPELGQIVNRACAKEPGDRFGSALELERAIDDYIQHRSSHQLVAAAMGRRAPLRTAIADREGLEIRKARYAVRRLIGESRFALEEALRLWPENEAAASALNELLVDAARYELAVDQPQAAAEIIDQLDDPPQELTEAVSASLRDDEARGRAQEELEELRHQLDPTVAESQRKALYIALGSIVIAAVTVGLTLQMTGVIAVTVAAPLIVSLTLIAITSTIAWVRRDLFLATQLNRIRIGLILSAFIGMSMNRAIGLGMGRTLHAVIPTDAVILATVALVAAVVVDLNFVVAAAILFAGAVLGTALGAGGAVPGTVGSFVVAILVSVFLMKRKAKRERATGEPDGH